MRKQFYVFFKFLQNEKAEIKLLLKIFFLFKNTSIDHISINKTTTIKKVKKNHILCYLKIF